MQLDGPALLQSVSSQLSDSKRSFQQAVSAATLQAEERAALEQSVRDLSTQQASIQRQLSAIDGYCDCDVFEDCMLEEPVLTQTFCERLSHGVYGENAAVWTKDHN